MKVPLKGIDLDFGCLLPKVYRFLAGVGASLLWADLSDSDSSGDEESAFTALRLGLLISGCSSELS